MPPSTLGCGGNKRTTCACASCRRRTFWVVGDILRRVLPHSHALVRLRHDFSASATTTADSYTSQLRSGSSQAEAWPSGTACTIGWAVFSSYHPNCGAGLADYFTTMPSRRPSILYDSLGSGCRLFNVRWQVGATKPTSWQSLGSQRRLGIVTAIGIAANAHGLPAKRGKLRTSMLAFRAK